MIVEALLIGGMCFLSISTFVVFFIADLISMLKTGHHRDDLM